MEPSLLGLNGRFRCTKRRSALIYAVRFLTSPSIKAMCGVIHFPPSICACAFIFFCIISGFSVIHFCAPLFLRLERMICCMMNDRWHALHHPNYLIYFHGNCGTCSPNILISDASSDVLDAHGHSTIFKLREMFLHFLLEY